jgi:TetR/AcrR family acrAB operon transcriptional repressor
VVRFDQKINSGQMVKMMLPSEIPDRPSRILAVTARLMAHYGYDKTIVDDIAREAGMSKGAIYLH